MPGKRRRGNNSDVVKHDMQIVGDDSLWPTLKGTVERRGRRFHMIYELLPVGRNNGCNTDEHFG